MHMDLLRKTVSKLVCPLTKLGLELCSIDEAEHRIQNELKPRTDALNARKEISKPVGRTPWVLLRKDLTCAYPIVDGIPILLAPEILAIRGVQQNLDLCKATYAEAYAEMGFYNQEARQEAQHIIDSEMYSIIRPVLRASDAEKKSFPDPKEIWIDAVYECASQWDAYRSLSPIQGKRVLQLGGKGIHAVKILLAGAAEAWIITPMLGETLCARALAQEVGVADKLHCVVAVAEELPLVSEMFDGIYSGGCLHHMQTVLALPEMARILRKGGTFAAVDPWRAPFYTLGTKILGKRESGAYCRPLTKARILPLFQSFTRAEIIHHGALTRYLLLALNKFGFTFKLSFVWRCNKIDDRICSTIPGLRKMGSVVTILGEK